MPVSDGAIVTDRINRGSAAYGKDDLAEAEAQLGKALALKPWSEDALQLRASVRQSLGRHADALADMDMLIARNILVADFYQQRAVLKDLLGRHADALQDRENADVVRGKVRVGTALGEARQANRAVLDGLNQKLPKVDFDGLDLGDAIQFLQDVTEITIEVDWPALSALGVDRRSVSIRTTDKTVRENLALLLASTGPKAPIHYGVADGKVVIPAPSPSPPSRFSADPGRP
ncbi:hypothetical protein LCGC14_2925470, partial [marine sediment metagenome]